MTPLILSKIKKSFKLYLILILFIAVLMFLFAHKWVHPGFPNTGGPAWYTTGGTWTNRKAITIDHTKVSGGVDLTDFPVLFSVTDTDLKVTGSGGSVGKTDGTDILFTASDGTTKLSHELEKYISTSGETVAWVKIPTLSATVDTIIYVYFGNAGASDQQDKVNVWNANYKGVWHLPNGTSLTANDSTISANNGTLTSTTATGGQVDGAANFDGSTSKIAIGGSTIYATTGAPFSVSAWINLTDFTADIVPVIMELKSDTAKGFFVDLSNFTGYEGVGSGDADGSWVNTKTNNIPTTGGWHYVVFTYNGSGPTTLANFKIYLDNSLQTLAVANAYGGSTTTTTIGAAADSGAGNSWHGVLDEVRVSNIVRPPSWIATEYNNQLTPSTFYAVGTIETPVVPDTTPPTVSMTAPSNSTIVSGSSVALTANASDDIGVVGVQFKLDTSTNIGAEDTTSAYGVAWDSTAVVDGSHTLSAVARDAAGNSTTATAVTVTVDNTAPVRSAGSPSSALSIGTTSTTISLSTNENATCKYSTSSGTAYGSMTIFSTTGTTSHSTTVSGLSNGGSYTYYVKCSDGQGNTNATDYTISFTVASDTTSPTVSITAPSNNATVSGSAVTISANATDDVSVAGVQFKLDGVNLGAEDTTSPYGMTWNSTAASDGSHALTAVARDGSGNSTTSSTVTVTVNNSTPVVSTAPSGGSGLTPGSTNNTGDNNNTSPPPPPPPVPIGTNPPPTTTPGCSDVTGGPCTENTGGVATTTTYNFGTTILRYWSRGEAVKELQRFLNTQLNLGLAVDGILGPKTTIAIRQYQNIHGLVTDGIVGPKTKASMYAAAQ